MEQTDSSRALQCVVEVHSVSFRLETTIVCFTHSSEAEASERASADTAQSDAMAVGEPLPGRRRGPGNGDLTEAPSLGLFPGGGLEASAGDHRHVQ